MENEISLITDFEESDYDLENIGLIGLHLVVEKDLVYFYNTETALYIELNKVQIQSLLINKNIVIADDEESLIFTEEQSNIVKDILNGIIGPV